MNNRRLTLSLALALALASPHASALGLGQLQVKSGLSQPLVAEIPIISASPAELEQLDVRLASPDAFARVGLDLPADLTANLQFSLGKNSAGQPVIRITTPNRFTEPFLSFLIEADWGKGKVTREYTALIDPPYIAPAVVRPVVTPSIAAAPVAPTPRPEPPVAATVEAPSRPAPAPEPARPVAIEEAPAAAAPEPLPVAPPPAPEPEPVAAAPVPAPEPVAAAPAPTPEPEPVAAPPPPAPEPEPVAAAPAPEPEPVRAPEPEAPAPKPEPAPEPVAAAPEPPPPAPAQPNQYGPVAPGQTLFSIANDLRQDGASVNQMMVALLRANPDAFAGDNVNELKRGSVLRVPRQDEITQLSDAEASSLVSQQMQAWRTPRAPVPQPEEASAAPAPVASAPERAAAPAPAPRPPRVASRPAPAAARLEISPPSGGTRARGAQSGAAAGAGGTELRAELAQAREDLAARNAEVKELKSRITELEQQQGDRQRLIDMQNSQLQDLQNRLAAVEGAKPAADSSVATPSAAPITIDAGSDAATTEPAAAAPAAAPPPAAAPAAPVAEATPEAAPPWYLNRYVMIGAILLIIGGLVLLMRRSKPAAVENGNGGPRLSDDEALRASIAKAQNTGARIPVTPAAPVIVPAGKAEPVIAPAAPAAPKAAAGGDGELALKALQDAVKQRPTDLEAHISLLRFLHSRGDADAYQDAAQAMRAHLTSTMDPRWREAVVMGASLLPKTQLFSQAGWNTPRFDGDNAPAAAAPAAAPATVVAATPVAAPKPAPVAPATPARAPATAAAAAPVRVFEPPVDEEPLTGSADINDPNMFGDFGGGSAASIGPEDEASATRIELAKAYLAIGDLDGARSMLEEVLAEGGAGARSEAARILKEIG